MGLIKSAALATWLIGLVALIGLTVWSGAGLVGEAIISIGWGVLLVLLVRIAAVSVAGAGWWLIFPSHKRPPLGICVLVRILREGTNALLPLAQLGGDLIGARVMTFYNVSGSLSAASVIVDVLLQAATQFLFVILGLLALLSLGVDRAIVRDISIGLAVALPALGLFYLAQRRAGRHMLQHLLVRLAGDRRWLVLGTVDSLYRWLETIYARRDSLIVSGIVHLAGWLIGVAEVVIVFAFMGDPVGLGAALVIESLMHAVRGAAFVIPGALGVQEGGLIILCAIFGIPPDEALALSLVKRVPDLVLGVPGLLAWQVLEGNRLRRNRSVKEEGRPT